MNSPSSGSGTSVYDSLVDIVGRHLSAVNAKAILNQTLAECGRTTSNLAARDLRILAPKLERALVLFLSPAQRTTVRSELEALARGAPAVASGGGGPTARKLEIKREPDIAEARSLARQMCTELNARSFNVQKVATVVSELARNIVSYSLGGSLELVPKTSPPMVTVIAIDVGPGIKNLDEIMSGNYRSKTGLGLGILGTKRLADTFTVESSPRGTRIEAGIRL